MMKRNHPIARRELSNSAARRDHDARGFMSVNAGRGQQVVLDLFQIGVTDTTRLYANQDLAGADRWRWDLFNANHAAAAVDRRVHGFGYDESVRIGSRQ